MRLGAHQSLADALMHRPRPANLSLSLAGLASPVVRYSVGCLLAARTAPIGSNRRAALREVRALVEVGNPWIHADPYMRPLMEDLEFRRDFRRLIEGPKPCIEQASLRAVAKEVQEGETVRADVQVCARPVDEYTYADHSLEVELAVVAPYSTPSEWRGWRPLPFVGSRSRSVVFADDIEMPKVGLYWLIGRARIGSRDWVFADTAGYDIVDPRAHGQRSPALVKVVKREESSPGDPADALR